MYERVLLGQQTLYAIAIALRIRITILSKTVVVRNACSRIAAISHHSSGVAVVGLYRRVTEPGTQLFQ